MVAAVKDKATAEEIFKIIGEELQEEKEEHPPLKFLGLLEEFNGIDLKQRNQYIEILCKNYIDRVLITHGWVTTKSNKRPIPMQDDVLQSIFDDVGPMDGSKEHDDIEERMGFKYRTILGELMYAYVTCRLDAGFAICTLAKFSSQPHEKHYKYLKRLTLYLR